MTRLEVLQPFVEKTIAAYLGIEEVKVWDDGTIPIRSGSTIVNVRLMEGDRPGHPVLQVYSPLLSDLDGSPDLFTKLNEVNANLTFVRAFWLDRQVILVMELLAENLDKDQVAHAVSLMSLAANFWDSELEKTFGGTTYFAEEPPPADPGVPAIPPAPPAAPPAEAPVPKGEDPPAAGYI
jgi:type III secretion system-like peptide-binding chaperone